VPAPARAPRLAVAALAAVLVAGTIACSADAGVDAVDAVGMARDTTVPHEEGSGDDAVAADVAAPDGGGDDVAGGTGDGHAEPAAPAEPPAVVAVVGDSLTLSASDEIEAALRSVGVETVVVDARENRRMTRGGVQPGVDAIDDLVADGLEPDAWVVALGTNDVGAMSGGTEYRSAIVEVLDTIPRGAPVVWVDVWIRNLAEQAAAANELLRGVARYRPWLTAVDWSSHGDDDGIVVGDGVHLTEAGQLVFASVVVDGVLATAAQPDGT
jgi:lysophospholipase L1-like esterase